MKVIYGIGQTKKDLTSSLSHSIVVIGIFDGLHLGHQALIKQAVARAKKLKMPCIVLTFEPHPVRVLHPDYPFKQITSIEHRIELIQGLGVDICVVARFSFRFSRLNPEQFVKTYLKNTLKAKEVFVGDDFRFGQERQGTLNVFGFLSWKHNFKLNICTQVQNNQKKISSTLIRRLIVEGKLKKVENLLGRQFSIKGKIEKGDQRGKSLGFPTINIYPDMHEILPPVGVYAVKVLWKNKMLKGMASVGYRESFNTKRKGINVEAHIFDFNENLYNERVEVNFGKWIRPEKKFTSTNVFIEQLKIDQIKAKKALNY